MAAQQNDGIDAHRQLLEDRSYLDSSQRYASAPTRPRLSANPTDVICGRGYHIVNHRGNLNLHLMVNGYREEYVNSKRPDKRRITKHVLNELKNSGVRFIRKVSNGQDADEWEEVDEEAAYRKVSHALRLRTKNESNSENGPMASISSASHQKVGGFIDESDEQKPAGMPMPVVSETASSIKSGSNGSSSKEKSQSRSTEIAASSAGSISIPESEIAASLTRLRSYNRCDSK